MRSIRGVILAAGGSSRMGRPKLLLPLDGKPLVRHVVDAALGSRLDEVVVVLGAHAEAIRSAVGGDRVRCVRNAAWESGLASSIRVGVEAASGPDPPDAIVLMVGDQPRVSVEVLDALVQDFRRQGAPRLACRYAGTVGVPALFAASELDPLRRLEGDRGARELLREAGDELPTVDFPEGSDDVDTPDDYQRLASAQRTP